MSKRIVLTEDPPLKTCVGCRVCELACSFWHEKKFNSQRSRIRVIHEKPAISRPLVCIQCPKPKCMAACPLGAIMRDPKTDAVLIKEDVCTGCGACVVACPFDGIYMGPDRRVAIKCDLCGGNPQCVRFCSQGVLVYGRQKESSNDI